MLGNYLVATQPMGSRAVLISLVSHSERNKHETTLQLVCSNSYEGQYIGFIPITYIWYFVKLLKLSVAWLWFGRSGNFHGMCIVASNCAFLKNSK
jgi:hypothetical protein